MGRIVNSAESVGDRYSPGLNRACTKIHAESGLWPVFLSPYGADRTDAQQFHLIAIGLTAVPPDLTDHSVRKNGGRAVDIDNWRAISERIGLARMRAILREEGWENITINGEPFPAENWHHANHHTLAWLLTRSVTAVGASVVKVLIPSRTIKETDMAVLIHSTAKTVDVPAGYLRYAVTDALGNWRFIDLAGLTDKQVTAVLKRERALCSTEVKFTDGEMHSTFNSVNSLRAQNGVVPIPAPAYWVG